MKKNLKICLYCGQSFDVDAEGYEKVGNRYLHKKCYEQYLTNKKMLNVDREENKEKYREVFAFAKSHFPKPNYALIGKQLSDYTLQGMKYKSILKTLVWYYDICKNDSSKGNGGIGIVPFVFQQAQQYYFNLWQLENNAKNQSKTEREVEQINIPSPKRIPMRSKKFNFLDKEGDE